MRYKFAKPQLAAFQSHLEFLVKIIKAAEWPHKQSKKKSFVIIALDNLKSSQIRSTRLICTLVQNDFEIIRIF